MFNGGGVVIVVARSLVYSLQIAYVIAAQMAGVETIWELHTLTVMNCCIYLWSLSEATFRRLLCFRVWGVIDGGGDTPLATVCYHP